MRYENQTCTRIHSGRTPGSDRRYRRAGRTVGPGLDPRQGGRPPDRVHFEFETVGVRNVHVPSRLPGVFPRENAIDGINTWDDAIVSTNGDIWYNALPLHMGTKPLSDYAAINANPMDFYYKASLFHCPSAKFSGLAETYPNFSYAMNSKLMVPGANVITYTALQQATYTPFFLDTGVPGERPIAGQKPYNGQPHAYASRFSARHAGSGNLAMADGHVETLRAEKVVDINPGNTNSYGKSIFPPVDVVWRPDPESNPNR